DLVGAPGFQLDFDVGMGPKAADDAVMTYRVLAAGHHGHLLTIVAVPGDRLVDLAASGHHTHHHAFVFPGHAAVLQLDDQVGLRFQGLGHDHEPGGVLVQPVDNTRARHLGQ